MIGYVRVAAVAQVPTGGRWLAFVDGRGIALFNVDGTVYALDDSCPHNGSSLVSGKLEGTVVTCRAHGLRFDVTTGRMRGVDGYCAKSYPVKVVEGDVLVGIERADVNVSRREGDSRADLDSPRDAGTGSVTP
jgi:3-phenylpropionate/trans-cinnamate dioxygenase ferredoxin subunit